MNGLTETQQQALHQLATDAGARRLHDVYAAHGAELRFVGGCVRDALLGIELGDIDMAVTATPDDGIAWLTKAGIAVKPTGIAHGTITAIIHKKPYEVTTLRRDAATDGRHATVIFAADWTQDAQRRDFTINGMSCDFAGTLYDEVGGLDDLRAGRVRFIGDAATRCHEDYLRILRLFRFWARFGREELDQATLNAVRMTLDGLAQLSAQRVGSELKKLLATDRAAAALGIMRDTDILSELLDNQFCKTEQIMALHQVEKSLAVGSDATAALRRLAMLMAYRLPHGWTFDPADLKTRLALSNKEGDHLRDLQIAGQAATWWTSRLLAALASFDRELVLDLCLISVALGHDTLADLQAIWPDLQTVVPPVCPVAARDLLTRGYHPGPELGAALGKMRDHWLETNCAATTEECLALFSA